VIVHREPAMQGYGRVFVQRVNESISPQLLPDVKVDLAELWRT
jgi:hypothetical protein